MSQSDTGATEHLPPNAGDAASLFYMAKPIGLGVHAMGETRQWKGSEASFTVLTALQEVATNWAQLESQMPSIHVGEIIIEHNLITDFVKDPALFALRLHMPDWSPEVRQHVELCSAEREMFDDARDALRAAAMQKSSWPYISRANSGEPLVSRAALRVLVGYLPD